MSKQESGSLDVAPPLMVELLYETKPASFANAVYARVKSLLPNTELASKPESDVTLIAHRDQIIQCAEGALPVQTSILSSQTPLDRDRLKPELDQTFEWPEARQVVSRATASLLLAELFGRWLEYKTRLDIFQKVLLAVTEVTRPLAIRWHRMIPPAELLSASGSSKPHAMERLALNVRFFRITNQDAGDMLMDTRGLAELGLPDLQIHYRGLAPGRVAGMLYNSALYIYEHGDVIQDGHTIEGLQPGDKWVCRHERSILEPKRVVLDINPGPPFTAGRRQP
jgi:hypothetical protein